MIVNASSCWPLANKMGASSKELVQIMGFFQQYISFLSNFHLKKRLNWFRIFMAKRTEGLKHTSKCKLWSIYTLQFISLAIVICLFCCFFVRLLYCFDSDCCTLCVFNAFDLSQWSHAFSGSVYASNHVNASWSKLFQEKLWWIILERFRTPVRQAFAYGIRHIFIEIRWTMSHSSLDNNENMPYPVWKCLACASSQHPYCFITSISKGLVGISAPGKATFTAEEIRRDRSNIR